MTIRKRICNIAQTLNAEIQRDDFLSLHELTNEYVIPHNIINETVSWITATGTGLLKPAVLILKACDNVS